MCNVAPFQADVVISRTVFWHNAFSTEITENNFTIVHVNKYVTWLRSIDKKYVKLENAWQSLAYSPLGAIVSPPSKYLWKTLTY